MPKLKLELGRAGHHSRLLMDGQEVRGLRAVTVRAAAGDLVTVELVMLPSGIEVESEDCEAFVLKGPVADATFTPEEIAKHQAEPYLKRDAGCRLCLGFAALRLKQGIPAPAE